MKEFKHTQPDWMDALVSGELSPAQYRTAIVSMDRQPFLWRACALAFLEDQAIRQELHELARNGQPWEEMEIDREPLPSRAATIEESSGMASYVEPNQLEGSQARIAWVSEGHWKSRLFSMAALVLLSFGVGWVGSGLRSIHPQNGQAVEEGNSHQAALVPTLGLGGSPTQGQSNSWDSLITSDVPSDSMMFIDRRIPEPLLRLEHQGRIRIESLDAIVPVELEDGRTALVPVQRFRVVPVTFQF
ncbi:MAG: hypothetical protein KDB03_23175 [Planctomycetales bacterium]|nr:hypothetical protein [Planctomycetales bacterium]